MGRNKGTNSYSNNYEPHVAGVLDARTHITGGADNLTKSETWVSDDGNIWIREGIRVSVTQDTDSTKNGIYLLLDDDYTQANNWLFIGSNSGGESTDSKVYVTTINFGNFIDDSSVTPAIQAEFENIISKWKQGYVILYHSTNPDGSNTYDVLLTERDEYNGWYEFHITNSSIRYSVKWDEDDSDIILTEETEFYRTNINFSVITNNKEYTSGEKAEVNRIINNARNNKKIYFKTTYNSISSSIMSGVVNVSYNGNEEITFSVVQPNGDIKYYSPNGSNSGTYWKVWTVEGKPTIVTLNTTGMLKRGRTSALTLNSSDVNKLVQLVSNKSNYANCIITYCGVEDTSSSDWQERVILNHTGSIYPPMDDEETNYSFWLSFITGNEARVFYFDITLTIPVDGGSPTAVASIIKEKKFGSDTTIKQLTTDGLFKYGRGEVISISSEDREILVSLFNGGYKKTALFYTYDGNIGGGNSYSAAVNVSGLLSGSFTAGGSRDLTLTVAAEGMVYKEILTYNYSLSTWTTKQDPVICTEEIEADVKNNGYWWDKKTGFVQQWGRVNAKAEGTTITLTKPMQFTLSATASPGTNSNNAIVQIFSTSGTSLVVKPDIDCTVYWHVIGLCN